MADSPQARSVADPRTRARDIDRAEVSTMLDAAYAEGQLGAQEYHDRVKRAGSARTLGELRGLTGDLQSPAVFGPTTERKRFGRKHSGEYPARTKARDDDRARTIAALDTARADGQLDAEEHTAMTELAAEARTLGELATLVAELQQRPAAPVKPKARNTFRIVTIAAVVLAAVGGFAWTIRADEPAAKETAASINYDAAPPLVIPTPNLNTIAGFVQFRDDYRTKFGDAVVDEAVLHDEHASAVRRAPDNGDWTVSYTYRGGFERSNSQVTTRDRKAVDIDLTQVNTDALAAVLNTAATTLGVPGGVVSHYRIANDTWVGRPSITVYVRNEVSQSAHLVLALSGEVLKTYPYER